MLIDENGKLFGKVNIIDLCVVLAIILAVTFIGTKLMHKTTTTGAGGENYVMKFYIEEIPDYVADKIKVGDIVEDEQKTINLGTITNVVIDQGYLFNPNAQGQVVKAYKEGSNAVEITSAVKAQPFTGGIIIDGNKYSVGHRFTIRAGISKMYLMISDIHKA